MRPAQRYLRRLRSFRPYDKVEILDGTDKSGHVFSQKDNPRLVLANTSGRVAVVIEFPSFYSGQLMWFTPDKVAHA